MNSFDASPILLSLRLALVSTGLLLVIGVPLGYWLAGPFSMRRAAVEFITCLPLVLPPTVVGFYLLWALRPGWWPAPPAPPRSPGGAAAPGSVPLPRSACIPRR